MILLGLLVGFVGTRWAHGAERRAWLGGGVVVVLAGVLGMQGTFDASLPWHMVGHIVVMFIAPLICAWALVRRLPRRPSVPWLPAIVLNGVMVASHTPFVLDAVMHRGWWASDVMSICFFVSGLWFFVVVWHPMTPLRFSVGGVLLTMAVMLFLAMGMSIFSSSAWYESMSSMPGMVMAGDFSSQQLAAAILWICGDLWAVPMLVVLLRRLIDREGSLMNALQRYSEPPSRR